MNTLPTKVAWVRNLLAFALCACILRAAVGDVTPLSRAEMTKVEAVLGKLLKGKSVVQSGTKQEAEGGWKITCVANVGSGGAYQLVVMTEKSMILGYVESQTPKVDPPPAAAKDAGAKGGAKK